ncbi:Glycosyl transferase, group 2 family protein [Anaerovibrio sp. JC8]|uniref:glycosyltransferase family 2 protein n=1 Tax=Anaerovibrio sp. JC8 TaxID=1240085 RepID=UPI000A09C95F|nr:glycosyltransferase [Anaerovibrio sp. JC8]ORU01002.1 Glycosyl transferase, group 2 family protein [Anaerovibrio sp. JC8]
MLSIIVPVYNVEQYLERCLTSLLAQEYKDIEIILVDDGSEDSSGKLCDDYAEKYDNVKVIHQLNGGLGAARNTGVKAAEGDYIAFVDSDDWVKPDMFSQMMKEALSHPDADMVKCGYCETDGKGYEKEVLFSGNSRQHLLEKDNLCKYYGQGALWVIAWNTIYRSDLAKRVEFPSGLYHEDNYASFFYLYYSRSCIIVNEPLYCYWQNAAGIMGSAEKLAKRRHDMVEVLERLLEYADGQPQLRNSTIYRKLEEGWAKHQYHLIRDDKSITSISKEAKEKIVNLLDFRRKCIFMFILLKRGIDIK